MPLTLPVASQIADAVIYELQARQNASPFAKLFYAKRAWSPFFDLSNFTEIQVNVVPRAEVRDRQTRGGVAIIDYRLDIGVQQKVAVDPDSIDPETGLGTAKVDDVDALVLFVEELADYLAVTPLTTGPKCALTIATVDPVAYPDFLREKLLFTSVINLTYRLAR